MDEEESSPATTEVTKEPVEAATPGPPSTSATTLTEVTEEPVEAARPEPPTLATTLTFVETPTAITTSSCALTKSEEKVIYVPLFSTKNVINSCSFLVYQESWKSHCIRDS
jgi:hypothetical protein